MGAAFNIHPAKTYKDVPSLGGWLSLAPHSLSENDGNSEVEGRGLHCSLLFQPFGGSQTHPLSPASTPNSFQGALTHFEEIKKEEAADLGAQSQIEIKLRTLGKQDKMNSVLP